MEIFSVNHHSQTVRAKELEYGEKVHLLKPVLCNMSKKVYKKMDKVVHLVGGGSVINGA